MQILRGKIEHASFWKSLPNWFNTWRIQTQSKKLSDKWRSTILNETHGISDNSIGNNHTDLSTFYNKKWEENWKGYEGRFKVIRCDLTTLWLLWNPEQEPTDPKLISQQYGHHYLRWSINDFLYYEKRGKIACLISYSPKILCIR